MTASERQLAHRAARGDLDALSELLKAHGPGLRCHLAARVGQRLQGVLDVEDVMQVTYLEAFLHITHFAYQASGSFSAWLEHIARNNLRDAIRELRRDRCPRPRGQAGPGSGSGGASALLDRLRGDSSTPSRQAACHEREDILKTAIARLPEDYRRVVQLCDIEGKSTCEAASVLNRSQGAVCMLRARAHDRLRELLGSQSRFFSDSG